MREFIIISLSSLFIIDATTINGSRCWLISQTGASGPQVRRCGEKPITLIVGNDTFRVSFFLSGSSSAAKEIPKLGTIPDMNSTILKESSSSEDIEGKLITLVEIIQKERTYLKLSCSSECSSETDENSKPITRFLGSVEQEVTIPVGSDEVNTVGTVFEGILRTEKTAPPTTFSDGLLGVLANIGNGLMSFIGKTQSFFMSFFGITHPVAIIGENGTQEPSSYVYETKKAKELCAKLDQTKKTWLNKVDPPRKKDAFVKLMADSADLIKKQTC